MNVIFFVSKLDEIAKCETIMNGDVLFLSDMEIVIIFLCDIAVSKSQSVS